MKITSTIVRMQQDDDGAYTGLVEQAEVGVRQVYLTNATTEADAFLDVTTQHGQYLAGLG